jgi:putative transcriptional regulator
LKRSILIKTRLKVNKSRKQVAKDLGISEVYLRKIEAGTSNPGRDLLGRIEQYYNISMRKLFPDLFLPFNDTDGITTIETDS